MSEKPMNFHNTGERRVILGPLPGQTHAGASLILGSSHDDVKRGERSNKGQLTGEVAEHWRKHKAFTAVRESFGVQVA